MKVLITGGLGYIGTTLVDKILKETEHEITILDRKDYPVDKNFFYDIASNKRVDLRRGDIQHTEILYPLIRKCDVVVNLAALVGEPICAKYPDDAILINEIMPQIIGEFCKKEKKRLIQMSTCSNYGKAIKAVNEDNELIPVSIYAITKVNAEKYLINNVPQAIILRCATAYGLSPGRTRFDILVNEFVRDAYLHKAIEVYVPKANRPICHVKDIAKAIMMMLDAKPEHRIYNIGTNEQNKTKQEIAEHVASLIKELADKKEIKIKLVEREDNRDYIVDFSRIAELGFHSDDNISNAIGSMYMALKNKTVSPYGGNIAIN